MTAHRTTLVEVLTLAEVCQRLRISKRTGEKLLADGRFPIPTLPTLGVRKHRFSSATLDEYLRTADTADL
jgi:excisionase family DNA binding protein